MQHRNRDHDGATFDRAGRRLSCQQITVLVAFAPMGEPVTREDLDQALEKTVAALRGEIGGVESRLRGEMEGVESRLRGEMRGEIGGVESRLRGEMLGVESRLRDEMRGEIGGVEGRLRDEMNAMEARLVRQIKDSGSEIAKEVANVMAEQLRGHVSVVDEKYQDLPRKYAALREDVDVHVADVHLHRPGPATPGKPARRT